MRRAATLFLFVLLAAALVLAQTPAGTSNNPPATPQTQSPSMTTKPAGTAPGEDTQVPGTQVQTPGSSGGATNQSQPGNPISTTNGQAASPNGARPQPNTAGTNAAGSFDQIAAGTEIRATLDTPLSTKTSKPGDRFTATITEPARGSNGSVVVPTGARVEGEVAEADEDKALPALRGKSKLSLRFRDVVLPAGQTLPLAATLISVNDTNGKNTKRADEEGQVQSGARGRDVAKDMGTGAGIGTAAGLVFGGPLKGLAIGTLAGGGYVLAIKGKQVSLPAQTGMVIRLDQPVSGEQQR